MYYPPMRWDEARSRLRPLCVLLAALSPAAAKANPEPAAYDTRSVSMGLAGTSFKERASALVLKPANLEGIEKLGFTFNFTGIFTRALHAGEMDPRLQALGVYSLFMGKDPAGKREVIRDMEDAVAAGQMLPWNPPFLEQAAASE